MTLIGQAILLIFFDSVYHAFQDYFSSYETGQSVGGVKMGEPREKSPGTLTSRTWIVSHVPHVGLKPTLNKGDVHVVWI